jgi:signal peptidase II
MNAIPSFRRLRGALVIALIVVVIDQLSKHWAVNHLVDHDDDLFWTLRFHLAHNTGMAFSKGTGLGPVIGIVALIVVVGLLVSIGRQSSPLYTPAVGLIVGGAVGNLLDRLLRSPGGFRGGVVDFIDVQWWPIFNVADIDAALERIADGTYGYSLVSGRPIPRERLEAIPWATVLVEEKVGGIGRR